METGGLSPPESFVCPISQCVMSDPTVVEHAGHFYTFDARCLRAHAKTRYADRNPLTNVEGFAGAPRRKNHELKGEIQSSVWASEAESEDLPILPDTKTDYERDIEIDIIFYGTRTIFGDAASRNELAPMYALLSAVDMLPSGLIRTVHRHAHIIESYIADLM